MLAEGSHHSGRPSPRPAKKATAEPLGRAAIAFARGLGIEAKGQANVGHAQTLTRPTLALLATYRIKFESSRRSRGVDVPVAARFRIWRDGEALFVAEVQLTDFIANTLLGLPSFTLDDLPDEFIQAVLRFGVRRIEARLEEGGAFPTEATLDVSVIRPADEEAPELVGMMRDKTCAYQLRDERDLLCAAAHPNDEAVVGLSGWRRVAPTSRPICRACNLPDTDYICSHFLHPGVVDTGTMGNPHQRGVLSGLCDLGHGARLGQDPSRCRAGGHDCWERLVEPAPAATVVDELPPLALPEAIDFLDAVWQLAFGKRLLGTVASTHHAGLAQPCADRHQFGDRLSDLVDVFDRFDVPAPQVAEGGKAQPREATLLRMQNVLAERLAGDEGAIDRIERAIAVLRAAAAARAAVEHTDAAKRLPQALATLGVSSYPPMSWADAWTQVRGAVIRALATIRDELRAASR